MLLQIDNETTLITKLDVSIAKTIEIKIKQPLKGQETSQPLQSDGFFLQ